MKKYIFISHSSVNKEIAEQLCSFLVRLGISEEKIFCSSIIGQGVNNGEKLNDAIGKAISRSKLLVYIISRDFLESSYCMEELGAGWYLSQQKKASCFYLIVPDIDLSDLKGFVNSKIDKFSFIDENHKEDLGLFAENICKVLKIKLPKHSVMANIESTFFSATKSLIAATVERSENLKQEQEEKLKEVEVLKEEIERLKETIENFKERLHANYEERKKELLEKEFETINERFIYLGFRQGITPKIYKSLSKGFWFDMVNRYLELQKELNVEYSILNYDMALLLATIYSANGDIEEAYKQLKLYVKYENCGIYEDFYENVQISPSNDMSDIIKILEEKIKNEPKGITQDAYKRTLSHLLDRKAKMEGKQQ